MPAVARRVAIVQSNYLPWKGYFDLIASVDEFILYDDVQYTRRDWRNRNRIKTPQGPAWLSVPVRAKGRYHQTIRETELDGSAWQDVHWRTLAQNYGRAPAFDEVASWLEPIFRQQEWKMLSDLNRTLIKACCAYLGIDTKISCSSDFRLCEGKSERLADLCRQANATCYVSGPSARSYLDESVFSQLGMSVDWFDYGGYPEYPQLWDGFVHELSVVDLFFNCGRESGRYMRFVER
ncbi:MAG: WbqC family protein [Rhodocyclaceae bacterium]|nr:WbqC family protein [Rhodocyclaceae bacterium]